MKKIKTAQLGLATFRHTFQLFLFLLSFPLWGQTDEQRKAIEKIAEYIIVSSGVTDDVLSQSPYSFQPTPGSLVEKEWPKLSAQSKLKIAYRAAENSEPNSGGDKFIIATATKVKGRMEAISTESLFKSGAKWAPDQHGLYQFSKFPAKIESSTIPLNASVQEIIRNIEPKVVDALNTIAKYTDAGALGGLHEVLRQQYGLDESESAKILLEEETTEGVLKKAHTKNSSGTKNTIKELLIEYESAHFVESFKSVLGQSEYDKSMEIKKSTYQQDNFDKKAKVTPEEINESKRIYTDYLNKDEDGGSVKKAKKGPEKYQQMRSNKKRFGGIVLGNSFSATFKDVPEVVRWIPYSQGKENALTQKGRLEFVMPQSGTLRFSNILQEDVYAAYQIVFGDSPKFIEGDGIGLTGLTYFEYPDGSKRNEIILHPAINFLSLGRSVAIADAYPECTTDIKEKLMSLNLWDRYKNAITNWDTLMPKGWKITERPLVINAVNGEINILDAKSLDENFLSMYSDKDDYTNEMNAFNGVLPALLKASPDYVRLNNFIKVVTVFRWIKMQNTPLVGFKNFKYSNFVEMPDCLIITPDKHFDFYGFPEDQRTVRAAIKEASSSVDKEKFSDLLKEVDAAIKKRESIWANIEKGSVSSASLDKLTAEREYKILNDYISLDKKTVKKEFPSFELEDLEKITKSLEKKDSASFHRYEFLFYQKLVLPKNHEDQAAIKSEMNRLEVDNPVLEKYKEQLVYVAIFYMYLKQENLLDLYNLLQYEPKIMKHYAEKPKRT